VHEVNAVSKEAEMLEVEVVTVYEKCEKFRRKRGV
jgi:hypothetical protein